MKPLLLLTLPLFSLFAFVKTAAQETPPLAIESFGYPDFGKGYHFGDFQVKYDFNENTSTIFRGMHNRTPIFEVFRSQILMRKRLSEKIYTSTGIQTEFNMQPDGPDIGHEAYFGLEYEPKPNILMHAGYQHLLNGSQPAPLGFEGFQFNGRFSFGSKWKF